jgi:hypothetical protein
MVWFLIGKFEGTATLTGTVTLIAGRTIGGSVMLTARSCIGAALVVVAQRSVANAKATKYLHQRVNMRSLVLRCSDN